MPNPLYVALFLHEIWCKAVRFVRNWFSDYGAYRKTWASFRANRHSWRLSGSPQPASEIIEEMWAQRRSGKGNVPGHIFWNKYAQDEAA